jgi:hypothetical protein
MLKKIFFVLVFTSLTINLFAQEKDNDNNYKIFDDDYFYRGRPAIDLSFGNSWITLKNTSMSVPQSSLLELILGYYYVGKSKYSKNIEKLRNSYALLTYFKDVTTWRFGFGSTSGYGYKLGKRSAILLYNANSIDWTRYEEEIPVIESPGNGINDYYSKIQDFNKTFRFGTGTEAGIIMPIVGIVNFQVSFDRTLVFPRHLVWKHLGSVIIEGLGQTALDAFIHAVFKASPESGPIVNFLLKNGLAIGLYELRRSKMNWPFETAVPMLFDSFKLGFNFIF